MHAVFLSHPGGTENVCSLILPESSVALSLVANSSTPVSSGSNRNRALWAQKNKIKTEALTNAVSGAVPP